MNETASFSNQPPEVQAYIRDLEARNAELSERVRYVEEQFRLAQLKLFAPSSEKRGDRVFNEAEQADADPDLDDGDAMEPPETGMPELPPAAPLKRGRKPLPADLPRKRVEYDVAPEQKICACCQGVLHRIGEDICSPNATASSRNLKFREYLFGKSSCALAAQTCRMSSV